MRRRRRRKRGGLKAGERGVDMGMVTELKRRLHEDSRESCRTMEIHCSLNIV